MDIIKKWVENNPEFNIIITEDVITESTILSMYYNNSKGRTETLSKSVLNFLQDKNMLLKFLDEMKQKIESI